MDEYVSILNVQSFYERSFFSEYLKKIILEVMFMASFNTTFLRKVTEALNISVF